MVGLNAASDERQGGTCESALNPGANCTVGIHLVGRPVVGTRLQITAPATPWALLPHTDSYTALPRPSGP